MFGISKREDKDYFTGTAVTELTPKDFDRSETYKLKSKECTVVMFYAPWCGFCKKSRDTYVRLAYSVGFANVAGFNCEKHQAHVMKMNQDHPSGEFVKSYPTIILYKNGWPYKAFTEERNSDKLLKFAMECRRAKY